MKWQYLHCYNYCKTALEGKTLSEDEMKNKGTAQKQTVTCATTKKKPWTEKTKSIYAWKTKNYCMWKRLTESVIDTSNCKRNNNERKYVIWKTTGAN